MRMIIMLLCLFYSVSLFSQTDTTFYLKDKIVIKIKSLNNFEKLEIRTSKNNIIQTIDSIEQPLNEKGIHLAIEDYNFDGFKDFSLFHIDDGKGIYMVYTVFLYNIKTNKFDLLEIPSKYDPHCILLCNLKIDKKNKMLYSSCRGGPTWYTDIWIFDKNKELKLIKKSKD